MRTRIGLSTGIVALALSAAMLLAGCWTTSNSVDQKLAASAVNIEPSPTASAADTTGAASFSSFEEAACAYEMRVEVLLDGQAPSGFDPETSSITKAAPVVYGYDCEGSESAGVGESYGTKDFTPQAPTYHKQDVNSVFDAQVNYRVAGGPLHLVGHHLPPLLPSPQGLSLGRMRPELPPTAPTTSLV